MCIWYRFYANKAHQYENSLEPLAFSYEFRNSRIRKFAVQFFQRETFFAFENSKNRENKEFLNNTTSEELLFPGKQQASANDTNFHLWVAPRITFTLLPPTTATTPNEVVVANKRGASSPPPQHIFFHDLKPDQVRHGDHLRVARIKGVYWHHGYAINYGSLKQVTIKNEGKGARGKA